MVRARLLGPLLAAVLLVAGCSSYDGAAAPVRATADPGAPTVSPSVVVAAAPSSRLRETPARLPAATVLHSWDRDRAAAWAAGDVQALADLYVRRSAAGQADVALLRSYLQRGFTVKGLRMQVFALHVLSHGPRRVRLRVTDRLARAVAVRAGRAVPLPAGRASTRVVALVRGVDGRWRVAAVRALTR